MQGFPQQNFQLSAESLNFGAKAFGIRHNVRISAIRLLVFSGMFEFWPSGCCYLALGSNFGKSAFGDQPYV
jgi:hypothetical protein